MIKRLIATCAVAAIVLGPFAASAAPITGTIALGHPASVLGLGVTENAGACDPNSAAQGVDGYWVELAGQDAVHLENTGDASGLGELDIFFYDAECGWIEGADLVESGAIEEGPIPAEADALVIVAFTGVSIEFILTLS